MLGREGDSVLWGFSQAKKTDKHKKRLGPVNVRFFFLSRASLRAHKAEEEEEKEEGEGFHFAMALHGMALAAIFNFSGPEPRNLGVDRVSEQTGADPWGYSCDSQSVCTYLCPGLAGGAEYAIAAVSPEQNVRVHFRGGERRGALHSAVGLQPSKRAGHEVPGVSKAGNAGARRRRLELSTRQLHSHHRQGD